jgi:hypothetical protein
MPPSSPIFLLHLFMLIILAAMGCGCCANQTIARKLGSLSIICSVSHLMSLFLSHTLPHPPPPSPSLPPLRIPARICKRKWVNKKIKSHEGSEELKALYCMHILFVIMFVNSLYSVMFLCVHKFESFSTLYWTEGRQMSAIVMTRLPFFMYDNFLFSTCCIFKHMKLL